MLRKQSHHVDPFFLCFLAEHIYKHNIHNFSLSLPPQRTTMMARSRILSYSIFFQYPQQKKGCLYGFVLFHARHVCCYALLCFLSLGQTLSHTLPCFCVELLHLIKKAFSDSLIVFSLRFFLFYSTFLSNFSPLIRLYLIYNRLAHCLLCNYNFRTDSLSPLPWAATEKKLEFITSDCELSDDAEHKRN